MENLEILVNELRSRDDEAPWIEFKHNNYNPDMIAEDISALANSATLFDKTVLICYGESMIKLIK